MPTLEINGRDIEVDDSFLSLSRSDQERTVDEIAASLGPAPNVENSAPQTEKGAIRSAADSVDAFGRGIVNAATLGFGDEIGAGARWLGGKILPWRDEVTYDQALDEVRGSDKALAAEKPVANVAGNITGAIGLGSRLVRAGLSPSAAIASRGGGLLPVSAASAVEGSALIGAQGFGQGEGFADRMEKGKSGLKWGLALGAGTPLAVSGITSGIRRAVTPFSTSPTRQSLVDALKREGVEVTAGQATGSQKLRYAESEIGGQAAQDIAERQGEQFTKAALKRAGIDAERATPEVIDNAFNRIGSQFDTLATRNTLKPDRKLQTDLVDTWKNYMSVTPPNARVPIVADTMTDINNALKNGGVLDGKAYQSLRSRLDRVARGSSDPELASTLRDIRSALDDGMERSIAFTNPKDLGSWRKARNEYRNMLVLEQAATGAGENAAAGLISPSALRNATVSKQGRRNYARGNGDFADLARAGEGIMKPLPQSGTAPRTAVRNLWSSLPSLIGAGAGGAAGGGYGAVAGAAAGAALPAFAGKLMMTPQGQAYLKNQLLSGSISPQFRANLAAAINSIDATFLPRIMEEGPSQVPAASAAR